MKIWQLIVIAVLVVAFNWLLRDILQEPVRNNPVPVRFTRAKWPKLASKSNRSAAVAQ